MRATVKRLWPGRPGPAPASPEPSRRMLPGPVLPGSVPPGPVLSGRVPRGRVLSGPAPSRRVLIGSGLAGILLTGVLLAGCGSAPGATVPSLGTGSPAAAGAGDAAGTRLHAAAQCVRQHGIPGFADPVRTAGGAVYVDRRSIEDAPATVLSAVQAACGALITRAGLSPEAEPPAPPQLVQAGVRSAECMRAHGLPTVLDPTARTPYTPGHGFGMTGSEVPGGKLGQGFQEAARACRAELNAEIRDSTLSSLASDG